MPHVSLGCGLPDTEPLLNHLLGGLFVEGLMPPGSIIDAGAADGATACFLASVSNRTVHAVEPEDKHVINMGRAWRRANPKLLLDCRLHRAGS